MRLSRGSARLVDGRTRRLERRLGRYRFGRYIRVRDAEPMDGRHLGDELRSEALKAPTGTTGTATAQRHAQVTTSRAFRVHPPVFGRVGAVQH